LEVGRGERVAKEGNNDVHYFMDRSSFVQSPVDMPVMPIWSEYHTKTPQI